MMTDELTDGELAQPWCSQEELSYLIRVIALDQVMLPKEIQALLGFLIKQNYASLYVVLLLIVSESSSSSSSAATGHCSSSPHRHHHQMSDVPDQAGSYFGRTSYSSFTHR